MKVFDIYSKRQRRMRGEMPDIFVYDSIPEKLRVQIIHIWNDAIPKEDSYSTDYFKEIHDILCREYGLFELLEGGLSRFSYRYVLRLFFLECKDNEKTLDTIELVFGFIFNDIKEGFNRGTIGTDNEVSPVRPRYTKIYPDDAIKELNTRFLENGIGYSFESGQIIRKDTEILHQEAVKPVLSFLSATEFDGANEEFLKAHEHYRRKRYKESLNECLKSFESVMKVIHDKHGWTEDQNDTAKKLIEICFSKNLVPKYLQSQFTALRAVLESGIPTARNKTSGHGQGVNPAVVPDYFARYVLNLTATTILLLVEAEKELP